VRRRPRIEPPLTTRECANYIGVTTEFIRGAIADGELAAEVVTSGGRRRVPRLE